jgi:hypothetical protein
MQQTQLMFSSRVILLESKIIQQVHFKLNYPSVHIFLKRLKNIFNLNKSHRTLTKYLSLVPILDYILVVHTD